MNKFFLAIAIGATATFIGCAEPPAQETTTAPTVTAPAAEVAPVSQTAPGTVPVPAGTVTSTTTATATPANKPVASNAKGLNPEHGKPGHRCDIPVGAPLSSPPANSQAQQVQPVSAAPTTQAQQVGPQITPIQPAPAAGQSSGTARLNPAHGQPGHDCAIPVGAPLKN